MVSRTVKPRGGRGDGSHFARGEDERLCLRFRVPPSQARPKRVFVACHYCGYDPRAIPAGGVCPKCRGSSWERFALPEPLVPAHMK
jgi:hypothetical protein